MSLLVVAHDTYRYITMSRNPYVSCHMATNLEPAIPPRLVPALRTSGARHAQLRPAAPRRQRAAEHGTRLSGAFSRLGFRLRGMGLILAVCIVTYRYKSCCVAWGSPWRFASFSIVTYRYKSCCVACGSPWRCASFRIVTYRYKPCCVGLALAVRRRMRSRSRL